MTDEQQHQLDREQERRVKAAEFHAAHPEFTKAGEAKHTPEQIHTIACMDSWAKAQGLATYSEATNALRTLLDLWHGGHLQVRAEASGAWDAAVMEGEKAIAKATGSTT